MHHFDIQSRLILLVLGTVLFIEIPSGWLGYQRAMHEADELLDAQLSQYVQIILSLAQESEDDEAKIIDIQGHHYQNKIIFQIWKIEHHNSRLILRSPGAPHYWPMDVANNGYSDAVLYDRTWRFYTAATHDNLVLAAQDLQIRKELARGIALGNVMPYFLMMPILALMLLLSIRHGLKPLIKLAMDLSTRDSNRLDDIIEKNPPHELQPTINALNQLFKRIRLTMENERRFTSDAAHELRTPIAAVRAQLQVAERTPDDNEKNTAIAKALRGIERMTHLVTQLLALARLDSESGSVINQKINLSEIIKNVIEELAILANTKNILFQIDLAPNCLILGNGDLLRVLARNLVDNALRYSPSGGIVHIILMQKAESIMLNILNNSLEVNKLNLKKLGARFYRSAPQNTDGVGLGLSIVRRIVELHQANIIFELIVEESELQAQVIFNSYN